MHELYRVLGLRPGSSIEQVQSAYRKLAHAYHPDTSPRGEGDIEKFRQATEAYHEIRKQAETPLPPIPAARMGLGAPPPLGAWDADTLLRIPLRVPFRVSRETVRASIRTSCDSCQSDRTAPARCSNCGGQGKVGVRNWNVLQPRIQEALCSRCQGLGRVPRKTCTSCLGLGATFHSEEVEFEITAEGGHVQWAWIPGRGHVRSDGNRGALRVRIEYDHSPFLRLEHGRIIATLCLTPREASRGGMFYTIGFEHPLRTQVPAGVSHGFTLPLRWDQTPCIPEEADFFIEIQITQDLLPYA